MRALAAVLVFGWHFTHGFDGSPVPFGPSEFFLLAPVNEGHCGVALFMTLSGYLFGKLLDGHVLLVRAFLWNRLLRLGPLLAVVIAIVWVQAVRLGIPSDLYAADLLKGVVLPTLPNGAWSVTVELHFYLLLPLILWLDAGRRLPLVLAGAIVSRAVYWIITGEVQLLAYWTIFGRIDQFLLGILVLRLRDYIKGRHAIIALATLAFCASYQGFARLGGFYGTETSSVWIILPTVEGAYFALLIAWYDASFRFAQGRVSHALQIVGTCSYSIYLLQAFAVFGLAQWAQTILPGMNYFGVAELAALVALSLMVPVAWFSFRVIERPFLRYRRNYRIAPTRVAMSAEQIGESLDRTSGEPRAA